MQPLEKRTTNLNEFKLPHFQLITQTFRTFSFILGPKRGIIPLKQGAKTGIIPKTHLARIYLYEIFYLIYEKSVIASFGNHALSLITL